MLAEDNMATDGHMISRCSHERERVDPACRNPLAHARGYAADYVLAGVLP